MTFIFYQKKKKKGGKEKKRRKILLSVSIPKVKAGPGRNVLREKAATA